MKHMIKDNAKYKLWLEVTDVLAPKGQKHVKLTSTFEGSRIPGEERRVFEGTFTPHELQVFANSLLQ